MKKDEILKKIKDRKVSIYTDSDFDGVVSAVFMIVGLGMKKEYVSVTFLNKDSQSEYNIAFYKDKIREDENFKIVCDLEYVSGIDLWFDHHERSYIPDIIEGAYDPDSKSTATLIYEYFNDEISTHNLAVSYAQVREITDVVDSASYKLDQILNPSAEERIPYLSEVTDRNLQIKRLKWIMELLLDKSLSEIIMDKEVMNIVDGISEENQETLQKIFDDRNVAYLNPEGIMVFRIKGEKFKVNSLLLLHRHKEFRMSCFIFGDRDDVDIRAYCNPVYEETFNDEGRKDYKGYDISQFFRLNEGGGHAGAGGFVMKKEKINYLIESLKEIDKLDSWKQKEKKINNLKLV